MADPRVRFLDLVPSVHSRVREWTVRAVRSKDIHEVKALNDRWLGSTFSKSFYLQFLYDASATCVVAEDLDGNIIGCGTAKVTKRDASTPMERDGHVLTLAVDPSWRRRGVGTDLLEALVLQIRAICVRISKQRGQHMTLKSVVLQTSAANLAALKFYEVCGYQRQSLKVGYYGGGKDAIPMRLSLADGTGKTRVGGAEMARTASGRNWVAVY